MRVLFAALAIPLLVVATMAQEPAEVPLYFAVGIPAGAGMTVDGDNSDWAWVDPSFEVTIDDMTVLTGEWDDADDFFVDLLMGWDESKNRVAGITHVHDNDFVHDLNPGCPFLDDGMELYFDANNSGDGPHNQDGEIKLREAIQIDFQNSVENPPIQTFGRGVPTQIWYNAGDYIRVAFEETATELYYEYDAVLYDPIHHVDGPDASTLWTVAAEQTIGWGVMVSDADRTSCTEEGDNNCQEAVVSTSEIWVNDGGFPDVFLEPVDDSMTAVEATSWGQLKALAGEDL